MGTLTPRSVFNLVATTGNAGFVLQNATSTIFTWTAPNDGQSHRVMMFGVLSVTTAQTGGGLQMQYTSPDNRGAASSIWGGGFGAGVFQPNLLSQVMVRPGTTVSFVQNTAQTLGAATVFAELWAS